MWYWCGAIVGGLKFLRLYPKGVPDSGGGGMKECAACNRLEFLGRVWFDLKLQWKPWGEYLDFIVIEESERFGRN